MNKARERERDCWGWTSGMQNLWTTRAFWTNQKIKKRLTQTQSMPWKDPTGGRRYWKHHKFSGRTSPWSGNSFPPAEEAAAGGQETPAPALGHPNCFSKGLLLWNNWWKPVKLPVKPSHLQPMGDFSQLGYCRLLVNKLLLIQVSKLSSIKTNSEVGAKHPLSILGMEKQEVISGWGHAHPQARLQAESWIYAKWKEI